MGKTVRYWGKIPSGEQPIDTGIHEKKPKPPGKRALLSHERGNDITKKTVGE